jgi:hypothetical protein
VALLVISINDPSLNRRCAEVDFALDAVSEALKEFGRGQGNVTSGNIVSVSSAGVANTSLGTWTYTSSAPNP